jgi:outer membrane protein OmpA-like peptidoglycan-associated protein
MENQENLHRSWDTALWFALAVILITFIIIKGCSPDTSTLAATGPSELSNTSPASTEQTTTVSIKVKLPDGTELVAYLNSTAPADSISKGRWFDFDNLNFKTGSTEITEASMKQVRNISAILKAYPKVSIKIGGYTDRTGNEPDNEKLSQQRAGAVVEALKKTGAANTQLVGAEGYGSQYARAAADAPDEERQADRRISVNVRSK